MGRPRGRSRSSSSAASSFTYLIVRVRDDQIEEAVGEPLDGAAEHEVLHVVGHVAVVDEHDGLGPALGDVLVLELLGEGQRVGDLVEAWLGLRNFDLELRFEVSTSCDNPLAESCS